MQNKLTRKASWEDMYRKHRNNVKNEVVSMYRKKYTGWGSGFCRISIVVY